MRCTSRILRKGFRPWRPPGKRNGTWLHLKIKHSWLDYVRWWYYGTDYFNCIAADFDIWYDQRIQARISEIASPFGDLAFDLCHCLFGGGHRKAVCDTDVYEIRAEYTHRSAGIFYCVCFDRACTEGRIFKLVGVISKFGDLPVIGWFNHFFGGVLGFVKGIIVISFLLFAIYLCSTLVSNRNIMKSCRPVLCFSLWQKTIRWLQC